MVPPENNSVLFGVIQKPDKFSKNTCFLVAITIAILFNFPLLTLTCFMVM